MGRSGSVDCHLRNALRQTGHVRLRSRNREMSFCRARRQICSAQCSAQLQIYAVHSLVTAPLPKHGHPVSTIALRTAVFQAEDF